MKTQKYWSLRIIIICNWLDIILLCILSLVIPFFKAIIGHKDFIGGTEAFTTSSTYSPSLFLIPLNFPFYPGTLWVYINLAIPFILLGLYIRLYYKMRIQKEVTSNVLTYFMTVISAVATYFSTYQINIAFSGDFLLNYYPTVPLRDVYYTPFGAVFYLYLVVFLFIIDFIGIFCERKRVMGYYFIYRNPSARKAKPQKKIVHTVTRGSTSTIANVRIKAQKKQMDKIARKLPKVTIRGQKLTVEQWPVYYLYFTLQEFIGTINTLPGLEKVFLYGEYAHKQSYYSNNVEILFVVRSGANLPLQLFYDQLFNYSAEYNWKPAVIAAKDYSQPPAGLGWVKRAQNEGIELFPTFRWRLEGVN